MTQEEKVLFSTYNDLKLCALLNIVNSKKEIVIICHARTSSKDSRPTTMLANELTKNKINNFRFDFVACGESDGEYTEYTVSNMIRNLQDTLDMLKNKYNFESFYLIGCSMGGRIVSNVDLNKYNIKKIILWYPAIDYGRGLLNIPSKKEKMAKRQGYYPIENGWKLSYEYFKDERKFATYKRLQKIDIPLLFVHGTSDPYVSYKSSLNTSKKCKDAKLHLIEGADHGFHNEDHMKEALEVTLNFIKN
ncbi:MAG: alpha/beta fold hydrolase [Bacilli bacterium]|nr:alpha/beta fold hydrolase [Bacilli bacterium]